MPGTLRQCFLCPASASQLKDDAACAPCRGSRRINHHSTHYHTRAGPHTDFGTYWGFSPLPVQGSHLPPRKTIKLYTLPTGSQCVGSHLLSQLGGLFRTMTAVHHSRATRHNTPHQYRWSLPRSHRKSGFRSSWVSPLLLSFAFVLGSMCLQHYGLTCVQAVYQEASCCVTYGRKNRVL